MNNLSLVDIIGISLTVITVISFGTMQFIMLKKLFPRKEKNTNLKDPDVVLDGVK